MSGCRRQCDWDDKMVCRSCGIDYAVPEPAKKPEAKPSPSASEEE